MKHIVVTIDGPAGTGKSTVAKIVADRFGFIYLDSGALYRAAALAIEETGCDIHDDKACGEVVLNSKINLSGNRIEIDGRDVTSEIRANHISDLASKIAVHPSVRKALLTTQRSFQDRYSLVAEGRDTGSVVFPDAQIKIYLDAGVTERAKRRYDELVSKGVAISYERVLKDVEKRDQRDTSRASAPLVAPEHAIVVDTTHLNITGVAQKVIEVIQKKLANQ
jgi:cytidylate kinase